MQFKHENELREIRFREFQDKHTGKKIFMTFQEALSESESRWKEYDYALTGSDQVWHNWCHSQKELAFYYLEFMPCEKRINYAPSFGFSEFPKSDIESHRKGLEGFKKLSCREESMKTLIMQAVGRESELVLDPTLLLKPEALKKFSSKPEYDLPDNYVLCYFLGSITEEYEHAIKEAAGDLPVIDINRLDSVYYITHPGEFLYLFEHADFICTDSFHGVAFSINFGKNFLVFRRIRVDGISAGMFGRIESIISNTGITDHIYETGIKIRPDNIDYDSVNQKLSVMRESSMRYLRECLNVNV